MPALPVERMPQTCTVWRLSKEVKTMYDNYMRDPKAMDDTKQAMIQITKDTFAEKYGASEATSK